MQENFSNLNSVSNNFSNINIRHKVINHISPSMIFNENSNKKSVCSITDSFNLEIYNKDEFDIEIGCDFSKGKSIFYK